MIKKKSNLIIKEVMDDMDKELLRKQAELLYPDCDRWIMDLALEAYYNSLKIPIVEEEPMIEIN
jgi:hypothetical protein